MLLRVCKQLAWFAVAVCLLKSRDAAAQAVPSEDELAAFRADIVVSFDGGGGGGGGEGEGRRLRQDDGDDGEGGGGALLQTKLQLVTASYCQLHF